MIILVAAILVTACLAGAAGYFYCTRQLSASNVQATEVIQALTKGDLKARVEGSPNEALSNFSASFNQLADHLEFVVHRFTDAEQKKIRLVQELGHDLRTPITSIRIALENLQTYFTKMTEEQRTQSLNRALEELGYMQRLIEFLFVIARVDLPDYQVSFQKLDLQKLIEKEVSLRKTGVQNRIHWQMQWEGEEEILVNADRSLLVRLVRNLLDNAQKFARTRVTISWKPSPTGVGILTIHDDGEGMNEKSLAEFGKVRKNSIEISDAFKTGQSLGIGSSIVKAISDLHDWRMKVQAVREGQTGTSIYFELKYSSGGLAKGANAA